MTTHSANKTGIIAIIIGMTLITINDSLIKNLADDYALHQIILIRSGIGGLIVFFAVLWLGGLKLLYMRRPTLQIIRVALIVITNIAFFTGLAAIPLAQATALFFIAPLLITLMSVVFLGHTVGPHRIGAIVVGFVGVLVMLGPEVFGISTAGWSVLLPLLAACTYAGFQILTRALGAETHPAAMVLFIQIGFVLVSVGFGLIAADGRFVDPDSHPSLIFLLRAWVWPAWVDLWQFGLIGVLIAGVGWFMTQAYRLADPATIAPFEYVAMPLATLWGVIFFHEIPGPTLWAGMLLISGSGLYVYWRERQTQDRRDIT